MPRHFPMMVLAELRAVFARLSSQGALVVALLVGIVVLGGMSWASQQAEQAQVNGLPVTSMIDLSWKGAAGYALTLRNFFVLPMLLVLATASTVSAEFGDNTLREVLVRPVSRWSVLLAKVLALLALSAATLLATLVPAAVGGASLFGAEGDTGRVLYGYAASWFSDFGLIALALLFASFSRSVGGVVVALLLVLMADAGARALLGLVGVFGVEGADEIGRMLPGSALACWEGWKDEAGWQATQFAGLALLIAGSVGVSLVRWARMDVP